MPVSDELLLKLTQIGAGDLAKSLDNVSDELDDLAKSQDKVTDSAAKSAKGFKGLSVGMADVKAGLDLVSSAGEKVLDFVKDSVEGTMKYAAEVRDLSRAIGANAEETSSLIQVADDATVSVGTLEAAFKAAIKKGIQPNIETLAKLSDEYLAIQDPVQRSQFAMEKFGRAGLDMAKILEQGGDAIKSAAREAKNLGLTLDEKAVKAARELEINMDNLGDKLEAFKTKVGNAVIPVLNEAASAFDIITEGSNTMADAFIGNQEEIYASLLSGEITLDDYNAKVAGMAYAVGQWDQATGKALQTQYTMNETTLRIAEVAKFAADAKQQQADKEAEAVESASQAQDRYYAALSRSAEKQAEEAAAKEAAAKADAIYRGSVSETIGKVDALAQSLAKSTDAQAKQILAQAQLDTLAQAFKDGTISQEDFNKATDSVLLTYDLATPKSLAMAEAQKLVNDAFLAGDIPLEKYVETTAKIPQIAADGKLSLEELKTVGVKAADALLDSVSKSSIGMAQTSDIAKGKIKGVRDEIGLIPEYKKFILEIEVTGDQIPGNIPGRAYGGPVSAGMPYLVGERGPEMFVPGQSGNIVPNQTNHYRTEYNISTDKTGLAFIFERQRQAQGRM